MAIKMWRNSYFTQVITVILLLLILLTAIFSFLNYEYMITHLQETWKYRIELHGSTVCLLGQLSSANGFLPTLWDGRGLLKPAWECGRWASQVRAGEKKESWGTSSAASTATPWGRYLAPPSYWRAWVNVFLWLTHSAPGKSLNHLCFPDTTQPSVLCAWEGWTGRQALCCKSFRLFTSCSLVRNSLPRIREAD